MFEDMFRECGGLDGVLERVLKAGKTGSRNETRGCFKGAEKVAQGSEGKVDAQIWWVFFG